MIPVYEQVPSYDEWCEDNDLDPDDDENYNSYCEWKSNC